MKGFVIGVVVFLSFLLQTTILNHFAIYGVMPNLCLVIIICFSLLKGSIKGATIGIVIGFLYDIIFGNALGVTALIYFWIGYFSGMFNKKVFTSTTLTPFVFTAVATLMFNLYQLLYFYFSNYKTDTLKHFSSIVVIETIYNAVLSIFIFKIISGIIKTPNLRFMRKRRS
ncbi:rod shape-determining protein MreD [Clostridiaceae bacterium M8S5]|nr:rod shape-determining protein MreD [Clostridiaceae bacterium M8S5]